MKAVVIEENQALAWADYEDPKPAANEVLIKVHASAINRADLMQRRGFYPPPPGASEVMGLECAGEVIEVGKETSRYKVGDRVCALLPGGGYAELAAADEGSTLPIPAGLSYAEAAALPEVFATAYLNLFMEAYLSPGEKVILHAGASGVGTAAIQLCQAFGNPCFVTAGSAEKLDACMELGAVGGSNRHEETFVTKGEAFAGDDGASVILDPVGGQYLEDNLGLLGLGGRVVLIGLMGGTRAELDLAQLMVKRIRIIGSTLRARPLEEKARVMSQLELKVWPLIESGMVKPIIDRVFEIEDVAAAHDHVASDSTIGKVILSVG